MIVIPSLIAKENLPLTKMKAVCELEERLCVVREIESVLKTKKSMDKMKATAFEELPTVKKVLTRVQQKDGSVSYQAAELKMHDQALVFMKSHYMQWVEAIKACAF